MALTAKFTADFSQFESAIKSASVTVATFEKGIKSAAADLNRLASSLSGAEIQRQAATAAAAIEAIGGATKLTAAEAAKMAGPIDQAIAKYKALGQQVPPELEKISAELKQVQEQAKKTGDGASGIGSKFKSELAGIGPAIVGAFSVGALVGFGKELLALGEQITDTANKLGISTDAVQELEYAAKQTGSSLDTFAGAMVKLQDKLVEGSQGSLEAFEKLNLSMEQVKSLGVDRAFTVVAEAIKSVEDPMQQTQLAMELFGKAGVEALPAIRQGMEGIREEAQKLGAVMSEENIKALDDFDQRLENTYKQIQIGATKSMGYLADLFRIATSTPWAAIRESIEAPDLPPSKAVFEDTGARTRANEALAEGAKRAKEVADAHLEAGKAAAKHAEEIQRLADRYSGAALQGEIKKTDEAFKRLTTTQKANADTVKRLVTDLDAYLQAGGKLTPALQRFYDEHRKLLPVIQDVTDRFRSQIIVLPNWTKAAADAKNAMEGLTKDGLIPIRDILPRMTTAIDTSAIRTNNLAGQFDNAATSAAALAREAETLAAADFGAGLASSIAAGFESAGVTGAIRGAGDFLAGEMVASMQVSIEKQIKAGDLGLAGAFGLGVGAIAIGVIATTWVDMLISAITADDNYRRSREAGTALGSEFAKGFGGPEAFRELAEAAGATTHQIARAMDGTAESVQEGIIQITPLINQYQQTLAGLGQAAGGTGGMAKGLADQFAPMIEAQKRALQMANEAQLAAAKTSGRSTEELAHLQIQLAEKASSQVFTATAENIGRINNLGTIIGGVIANTAGRTGDLVGAVQAVGPALESLSTMRDQFALTGEALSPATAEVLKLYDTIKGNEDVFASIQGLGQVMTGLGQGMIANSTLANAFGSELSANFATLQARGVEANVALATMAPQLQELWELSEQGTITVDETTQALLNQAEAQGIVGGHMKDVNKQILDVLTEIKEMFATGIPGAIARTGSTAEAAAGQMNRGINTTRTAAQELATDLGPKMGVAAHTGQLAVLDATAKEHLAIQSATREAEKLNKEIGPGMTAAASTANRAIDTIANRRITIPIHFDMDEPPPMPDYPAPSPPTQPGDAGTAQAASAPPDAGHTEVNFNVDGNTLARIVAPRIPGVVNGYVVG